MGRKRYCSHFERRTVAIGDHGSDTTAGTAGAQSDDMGSSSRRNSLRRLIFSQARQDSNLQPPVLEPAPSNAGIGAFVDFQRLSFGAATPAFLDTAGVHPIPDTH